MQTGRGNPVLSENMVHVFYCYHLPNPFSPFSFLLSFFLSFSFFLFPPFICYGLRGSSEPSCSLPKRQTQALHELRLEIGWILHCGASALGDFIFLCKYSLKISASHLSFWYFFPPCMASRSAQGEWPCSCFILECSHQCGTREAREDSRCSRIVRRSPWCITDLVLSFMSFCSPQT